MAVVNYRVKVNGGSLVDEIYDVGNVTSASIGSIGIPLESEVPYSFRVAAGDAAGNYSEYSEPWNASPSSGYGNVALPARGGVASAQSEATGTGSDKFQPSRANDGTRHTNNNFNSTSTPGGAWAWDGALPQWWEVDLGQSRTIDKIDVIGVMGALNYDTDPVLDVDTFSVPYGYGFTEYKLQYWNGSSFVDIVAITGNNKVWRQHTFSPIATQIVRLVVQATAGGGGYLAEVQVWGE